MSGTCPACGGARAKEVFRWPRPAARRPSGRPSESDYGRAGRIVRCVRCGLVRQNPFPHAPYEEAEDPEYATEEAGLRATARRSLRTVAHHRPPPGRLLDAGCGTGVLLDEARRAGWQVVGVEPSSWAAGVARRRGVDVLEGRLDDVDIGSGSVDAIVLGDIIEHVPDPVGLLRRLHRWAAPGGVLLVLTPDVGSSAARLLRRWWWSVLPGHLLYFSRTTLSRLLGECGFDVAEVRTDPKTFSVGYYLGRLSGYAGWLGQAARRSASLFGAERLITPDFRDRMAVVARRRG